MGTYVSPYPETSPTSLPIPLGCTRAPALGALLHASNLHWSTILHIVIYMGKEYIKTVYCHPAYLT